MPKGSLFIENNKDLNRKIFLPKDSLFIKSSELVKLKKGLFPLVILNIVEHTI